MLRLKNCWIKRNSVKDTPVLFVLRKYKRDVQIKVEQKKKSRTLECIEKVLSFLMYMHRREVFEKKVPNKELMTLMS